MKRGRNTPAAILAYCLLPFFLASAAPTDGKYSADESQTLDDTTSFKPQHIDFTLWNVNQEQFSKRYAKIEPDEPRPQEHRTTFWTVTSEEGNGANADSASEDNDSLQDAEPFPSTSAAESGELLSTAASENGPNFTEPVIIRPTRNASEIEATSAPQSNHTSNSSSAHNSSQEFTKEFDDVELRSISGANESDPEIFDLKFEDSAFPDIEDQDQIDNETSVSSNDTVELYGRSREGSNETVPDVAELRNGTRSKREGSFGNSDTETVDDELQDDEQLEIYSQSSKYFGSLEKMLNDDFANEALQEHEEFNMTDFDRMEVNVTDETGYRFEDGNFTSWELDEMEDEELAPEDESHNQTEWVSGGEVLISPVSIVRDYIRLSRTETLKSDNGTVEDLDQEVSNSTVNRPDETDFLEDYGKNETGDYRSDGAQILLDSFVQEISNSTEDGLDEFIFLEDHEKNETRDQSANVTKAKSEKHSPGGRSFNVSETKSQAPDDSINYIDSKDHEEGTTVVFDLFGYVNSTWPLVQRFTTGSTSRSTEASTQTTVIPATEFVSEVAEGEAAPQDEPEATTFQAGATQELELAPTSTDATEDQLPPEEAEVTTSTPEDQFSPEGASSATPAFDGQFTSGEAIASSATPAFDGQFTSEEAIASSATPAFDGQFTSEEEANASTEAYSGLEDISEDQLSSEEASATEDIPTESSTWLVEDSSQHPTSLSSNESSTYSQTDLPAPASTTTEEAQYEDGNIITLLKHLRLSLLGDLLKRTGLDKEFSKSNQSITIFAPTDEAFNSLSPSTIRKFQKNSKLLKSLLLHHMVDKQISAEDFENERTLQSLAQISTRDDNVGSPDFDGQVYEGNEEHHDTHSLKNVPLKLNLYDKKGATIDGARFILADIRGTNGIIHVITKVLYRFARHDLITSLTRCSRFSTLLKIAEKANIDLKDGPYTIFAPVNEAWEKNIVANLTVSKAKEIFNSHVVEGSRFSSGLADEEEVETLKRYWTVKVGIRNGELKEVNRARVIMSDVPTTNGVIHVIDRTLHETKLCDDFF